MLFGFPECWKNFVERLLRTPVFLHYIEVFKVEQFSNPWIISEVVHGKSNHCMICK